MKKAVLFGCACALFAAGWLLGQDKPPQDFASRMAAMARMKQAYADGLAPVAGLVGNWKGKGTSPWGPFEEEVTSEWIMDGGLLQVTSVRKAMGMVVGQSSTVFAYDPSRKEIYAVVLRPYGNAVTYRVTPAEDGKVLQYDFVSGIGPEALPFPIRLEIHSDTEYAISFDKAGPGEASQKFESTLTKQKKALVPAADPKPEEKPKKEGN